MSKPPAETVPVIFPYKDSPFGVHPAYVTGSGYEYALDINIRWDRPPVYIFWFKVQPNLTKRVYDWSEYDRLYAELPEEMNLMVNITTMPLVESRSITQNSTHPKPQAEQYVKEGSYLPIDEESYVNFVRAAVERYDGDGINDMPGLKKSIKYWQVDNEPPHSLRDYASFLKITYQAIKEADPNAKVLIGGVPGMPPASGYLYEFDRNYLTILKELAGFEGQYFDIFDFHWYGNATGDYPELEEVFSYIKQKIDALGLTPPEGYWITEMGTYSGDPMEGRYAFQTEQQQARDLIKRNIYSLSLGIKKIFLAFGLIEGFHHTDGYFDHTGLIYDGKDSGDPGRGIKKLAYYTYKLMAEKLEGSDWDNIETVSEANNVHIYRLINKNSGKPIWVAWWDYFADTGSSKTVTLNVGNVGSVRITEAVPETNSGQELKENDYPAFFETGAKKVSNGAVSITLGANPVLIEIDEEEGEKEV